MLDGQKRYKSKREVKYMKYFKKFLRDQRGVSPVIGVILMVAVTVVMGAAVAGFVYGFVGTIPKAPNVALSALDDPKDSVSLLLKHSGGESIPLADWEYAVVSGKEAAVSSFTTPSSNLTTGTSIDIGSLSTGWYHVVAVHKPSDAILLDTNVLVR